MDPLEEQQQELEVLQSIYPEELEVESPTLFSITISLDTSSDRKHKLILHVKYPPEYPEVVPTITLSVAPTEESHDEDEEEDENKLIHIAETIEFEKDDLHLLLGKLNEEAELNIGMPSVFALATQLKDEAEMRFEAKVTRAQKEYDDALLAKEKEEQQKFVGTKVTKESWTQWRNSFRQEMNVEQQDRDNYERIHGGKLTGREIFERGLANEEDLDLAEGIKQVSVA